MQHPLPHHNVACACCWHFTTLDAQCCHLWLPFSTVHLPLCRCASTEHHHVPPAESGIRAAGRPAAGAGASACTPGPGAARPCPSCPAPGPRALAQRAPDTASAGSQACKDQGGRGAGGPGEGDGCLSTSLAFTQQRCQPSMPALRQHRHQHNCCFGYPPKHEDQGCGTSLMKASWRGSAGPHMTCGTSSYTATCSYYTMASASQSLSLGNALSWAQAYGCLKAKRLQQASGHWQCTSRYLLRRIRQHWASAAQLWQFPVVGRRTVRIAAGCNGPTGQT